MNDLVAELRAECRCGCYSGGCDAPGGCRCGKTCPCQSEPTHPRWITTWPYELQPTFGSSTIDWTKVEVVPAYTYDALTAELASHKQAAERFTAQQAQSTSDRITKILQLEAERDRLRAALQKIKNRILYPHEPAEGTLWDVVRDADEALAGGEK